MDSANLPAASPQGNSADLSSTVVRTDLPALSEQQKVAFEAARDSTKQFLTLSTGAIALTITFSKDFLGQAHSSARPLALGAWVMFLFSVLFGLWSLLALTGSLDPRKANRSFSINTLNITLPAGLQVVAFAVGLVLTVLFGVKASSSMQEREGKPAQTTQASTSYRQLMATRLVDVADSVAFAKGYVFDTAAAVLLQQFATDGAAKVSTDRSIQRRDLQRAVDSMIRITNVSINHSTGRLPPQSSRLDPRTVDARSLRAAIFQTCPLWPFC